MWDLWGGCQQGAEGPTAPENQERLEQLALDREVLGVVTVQARWLGWVPTVPGSWAGNWHSHQYKIHNGQVLPRRKIDGEKYHSSP